jgi:hypothetical protein
MNNVRVGRVLSHVFSISFHQLRMLAFIISMRSRNVARDWDYHTRLLQCTLDSIFAQTNPEFEVVIVGHDTPEIPQIKHAAVHLLKVDFPPPKRIHHEMATDKILKISRGIEWAITRASSHVMFVDADDLVSRRLSDFVVSHPRENGWYFQTGYTHTYGQSWMRKQTPHHRICGTCLIVRKDLLRFAHSDQYTGQLYNNLKSSSDRRFFAHLASSGQIVNTLAAEGHGNYVTHLAAQGTPVQPLPFYGAVYILREDSTSMIPGSHRLENSFPPTPRPFLLRAASAIVRKAKVFASLRPLTTALRMEFNVPTIDGVQAVKSPARACNYSNDFL